MKKKVNSLCSYINDHRKIFIKMRYTLYLFLLFTLQTIAGESYSQVARITLNMRNSTVREVLSKIEKESEFYFLYNNELIDVQRKVNISVKNEKINNVLYLLFNGKKVNILIHDHHIVLTPSQNTVPKPAEQPQSVVTGRVIDAKTGIPLPGVSVQIKGTNNGVITNTDGNYTISAGKKGDVLIFSFIGYAHQRVTWNGQKNMNVSLTEDLKALDEVVVVGFGTQKKVNLTGAVDMVKGDAFVNRPISSVASGLQGLVPGLTVTSSSGQPGNAQTSIVVRGINTINSSTSPLILIDGVIGESIDLINPDDIESVSVLKDAASSAIYGARAANGVILITTKKGGKSDQVKVNYSGYVGIQTATTLPEMVNGREYMTLLNEAMQNAGLSKVYSDDAFSKYDSKNYPNDYSNTNWLNQIYKKYATQSGHNLNLNGGTGKIGYYMSYGNLHQGGIIVGDPYKSDRNNFRINVNTQLSDRLKVDGSLSYIDFFRQDAAASGTGGVFRLAQRISPLLPVMWQTPTANGGWEDSNNYSFGSVSNPINVARNSGYRKVYSKTTSGVFNADLKIFEGLNLKGLYAFTNENRDNKNFSNIIKKYKSDGTEDAGNASLKNSASESFYNYLSKTTNITLNYETHLGNHSIKAIAGASKEWGYNNWVTAYRKNIIYDGVEVVSGGTEDISNSASGVNWGILSYFGRINYDFAGKYLVEANIRRDGTSRFSSDNNNRWGTFPSFSAGWKFSEEKFMDFSKSFLSMGKIRASWGELGNQDVGDYFPYLTSLQLIDKSYPIGGVQAVGIYQPTISNPNIKWETLRMLNIGLDLQTFDNRLGISFDWFKKNNIDALLKPIYPSSLGTTSTSDLPYVNMGEIENKGWELNVNWNDKIGNVKYGLSFNLSDAKNKVLDLGESAAYLGSDAYRKVGDPLNAYYGFVTGGLLQPEDFEYKDNATGTYKNPKVPIRSTIAQPGDIKYLDISGPNGKPDGVIDDYDKAIIGERYPRYNYAMKGNVEWKNIYFSFFLQGIGKVNGYLTDEARHCFINDYSIPQKVHLDRWTPNNHNASYPRLYYGQTHNLEVSDYWILNAAYLRVKNIQVGYTVPKEYTQKIMIDKLRIYLSADNLFTISNYYKGYDPEIRSSDGDSYPQMKTFVLGVNVTFK